MHQRRTNCTLTKAASIPARRQRAQGFLDCFSRVRPPSEIKSNFKFKTLKRHLTLSESGRISFWCRSVISTSRKSKTNDGKIVRAQGSFGLFLYCSIWCEHPQELARLPLPGHNLNGGLANEGLAQKPGKRCQSGPKKRTLSSGTEK